MSAQLRQAFLAADVRPTVQRYAVLQHLARHGVHATAEEIFRAVNRQDPRASRATVYNSLKSLTRAGLVREVISEGKAACIRTIISCVIAAGRWKISPGSNPRLRENRRWERAGCVVSRWCSAVFVRNAVASNH
jgi:DNA-binding transcriptional ArsR family regulator